MTNAWQIRTATSVEAPTLALVGAATFLESFAGIIDGPAIVVHCALEHAPAAYRTYLADPRSAAWIAQTTTGAAPVGYALVCPTQLAGGGDGDLELKRIYALSRFHGTGMGAALMHAAVAYAREQGANRLLLGSYAHNHRAIAFYRRQGFKQTGTRRFQVGQSMFDDIVMTKQLA